MLKIYDPIYAVSIDGGPWERLEDPFDTIDRKYIKKCEGFCLRAENRLRENVTLDWILKHLKADQAIQYLTERGMGICPITKTK